MTKVLVLDAGHGMGTPGKQTLDGSKGVIKEFALNQAVVEKIAAILSAYDVEIKYTHDLTGATDVLLSKRVERCNQYNPDLFISIHHNAYQSKWGNHGGVEVYHHSKGTAEDKKFATLLAPKLAESTGLRNRGVKNAEFTVLCCKATAVLVEGGFMDSNTDYSVITSDKGQQAYAQAVADAVIQYLGLTKKPTAASNSSTFYQVIVGSYAERSNADKIKAKLESQGYTGVWINVTQK